MLYVLTKHIQIKAHYDTLRYKCDNLLVGDAEKGDVY